MGIIYLLSVVFGLMLVMPVAFAVLYYKNNTGEVLHINQTRIRDTRYFSKSFVAKLLAQLPNVIDDRIKLSQEEKFWNSDIKQDFPEIVERMIIGREKDFHPNNQVKQFQKEIYCEKNILMDSTSLKIRAAYAGRKAILGNGVQVLRWIDAEDTLAIYDDCDLGMSASARQSMSIGCNCHFRRLYAEEIFLGQYPGSIVEATENRNPTIYRMPVQNNRENNIRYISKEMINDDGVVDCSIISKQNVSVTEQIIIQGDIRSHQGVRLCDGAVVCGNIFAEGNIHLGKNTTVLGNVFSQGSIYLEERACVGQKGKISSVIAHDHITFEKETFVFGYVSCEKGGVTVPNSNNKEKGSEQVKRHDYQYLETPTYRQELTFRNLHEYEQVDREGFRNEKGLRKVSIPDGALCIPESQFFGCKALEEVNFPTSIQCIGNYAFSDCYKLKDLKGIKETHIEEIGISAFENCKSLTEFMIHNTVLKIGGAAFSGCSELATIIFEGNSVLTEICDHAFRGCSSLEEIHLPESVKKIGVSAFLDCHHLKRVVLSEACKEEPGISELKKMNPQVEICYRKLVKLSSNKV